MYYQNIRQFEREILTKNNEHKKVCLPLKLELYIDVCHKPRLASVLQVSGKGKTLYQISVSVSVSVCLSVAVCLSVTHDQLPSADIVGSIQPKGQKFFLFPHVAMWAHFLSRANAQKVSFGIFTRALQHTTFKPLHTSVFSSESVCLYFLSSLVLAEDAPAFF